jgi:hypothetical protein
MEGVADILDLGGRRLVYAGKRLNADVYQELLDGMWSPWSRGQILAENTSSADLALVHTARTAQQFWGESWTLADWLPYSPHLNPLDFAIWRILQAKTQAVSHTNLDFLHLSIAAEWDQLAVEDIYKSCQSFCSHWHAIAMKNEVKL